MTLVGATVQTDVGNQISMDRRSLRPRSPLLAVLFVTALTIDFVASTRKLFVMAKTRRRNVRKRKPTAIFSCLARTKSIMESTRDSIASLYEIYEGFCQETTLHGLKHTVEDRVHYCERILWFVLTVSAFFGAVYCALMQYYRYNSEPVVVSLQRDYRSWWSHFPAVTACLIDRVDPELARETIEMYWNVTEDSDAEKYSYYLGLIELVADVSFRSNLQNFWKYQTDESVKDIDLLQLAQSVHPAMHISATVSDYIQGVIWVPVMTEVGMCLTFNSEYSRFQFTLRDIERQNEHQYKCHYHSGQCFVRIDSVTRPIRYFIHSPLEISTSISNPTGEVAPGEELVLDFKTIEIQSSPSVRSLRPDQRRCRYPDEWISKYIQAYSFGLCQLQCRNRMALMFCGCRPFFYVKGDGEACDAHGMACIGRNVEILINLPKNLSKCPCLPQCAELNFYSHTKKVVNRWFSKSSSPIASLGGTTALFVGASVLTVVETMLFIVRRCVGAVLLRRPRARVRPIQFRS